MILGGDILDGKNDEKCATHMPPISLKPCGVPLMLGILETKQYVILQSKIG